MTSVLRRGSLALSWIVLGAVALAGCGGSEPGAHATASAPARPPSGSTVSTTAALDSMAVLGHSGTTGFASDPDQPTRDVPENSWATGTNPAVDSIYQRLLATHPALEGHAWNFGVDGSGVDDLAAQVEEMVAQADPAPDLVIIQSIDNDMQCDGTDAANQRSFGNKLDRVLDTIQAKLPAADVFLVDQPVDEQTWVDATRKHSGSNTVGSGPCDTLTAAGAPRPAGIASYRRIVAGYFAQVARVCAAHPRCWTDRGYLQKMPLTADQVTVDGEHFAVSGLATEAAYAWQALPAAIKNRR